MKRRKFETKEDVMPKIKIETYTPKPDMGKVQPPATAEKICECSHLGNVHYGGPKGWCNTGGCDCQVFK
jgi:hypothetical protein